MFFSSLFDPAITCNNQALPACFNALRKAPMASLPEMRGSLGMNCNVEGCHEKMKRVLAGKLLQIQFRGFP
jgi:hypothetical protein